MTTKNKVYHIRGKEIEGYNIKPEYYYTGTTKIIMIKFNEILEALNEEKEESKSKRDLYDNPEKTEFAMRNNEVYKQICKEEPKPECKHKNTGNCLACYNEVIEPKSALRYEIKKIYNMSEEIKQFRENLKRQIEVNKIGCCVGCGLTPEGLDQIISQALQKQREEIIPEIEIPVETVVYEGDLNTPAKGYNMDGSISDEDIPF